MTTAAMTKPAEPAGLPDMKVSVRQVFGIDSDLEVPAYSEVDPHVPEVDSDYRFDRATTLAVLAGFANDYHHRNVSDIDRLLTRWFDAAARTRLPPRPLPRAFVLTRYVPRPA